MIERNQISATTTHQHDRVKNPDAKYRSVVSLTRDIRFAKRWGDRKAKWDMNEGFVVLELDQQKLTQNFKILPYNHFQDSRYVDDEQGSARRLNDVRRSSWGDFPINQYEENVVGDIKPLNKYLVRVHYYSSGDANYNAEIEKFKDKLNVPFVSDLLDRTRV